MRSILSIFALVALSACGGGDVADDFVRAASRDCPGPFTGSFNHACDVELRLAGTETITVSITGRLATETNTGTVAAGSSRSLRIQLAGDAAGFQTLEAIAQPGAAGVATFTLQAEVSAGNLGGEPAVIGLGSFQLLSDLASTVTDVSVTASAR